MVFGDKKLDDLLHEYRITQLSFLTSTGAQSYKQKFIEQQYLDITPFFINQDSANLNIQILQELMNANHTVFDLNAFYDYWVILSGKSYNTVTWAYYEKLKQLLQTTTKNIVAIAHKRHIHIVVKEKIEPLDNVLFCDFADLYIYPVYHEYKLFTSDMTKFNNFTSQVTHTGEAPEKYNVCMIQYMKLGGQATERVYY